MENETLLNQYKEVCECEYKERRYLVRDNGAICRLPIDACHPSKMDNVWSFGKKDSTNGYMIFTGNIRVHQVVCTAFHGPEPEPKMVVDHIDTNRCNNRPENLRWFTRLENALNNEATRRKIIHICGSIEAFIKNPSILSSMALPPNIGWMRTVTKEEAEKCKKHIERWAKEDAVKTSSQATGQGIGEWIFSDEVIDEAEKWNRGTLYDYNRQPNTLHDAKIEESWRQYHEVNYGLKDSLTPGAKQISWKTPTEFLLCPQNGQERTLQSYQNNLTIGKVFSRNQYGDGGVVLDFGLNETDNALIVLTQKGDEDGNKAIKPWALCKITMQDGYFVHKSEGSFFYKNGGQKYFTLAMGREWTGGQVFDDLC